MTPYAPAFTLDTKTGDQVSVTSTEEGDRIIVLDVRDGGDESWAMASLTKKEAAKVAHALGLAVAVAQGDVKVQGE